MSHRVAEARRRQRERFVDVELETNAEIPAAQLGQFCQVPGDLGRLLKEKCRAAKLSLRGEHAVRRVARTVADLAGLEEIGEEELKEAIRFRTQGNLEKIVTRG